ncbi:GpE family phage tail protein [Morganella morganii subsp. morganii]|nr:GpE family phage tail protein [Morganella morganii]MBT0437091.1 GpE family phage tail protein [Morganella morganii subsp. morganii]MBT0474316.1 GpE family phage tail protein [Morganella morganii subsp. morganii]MBT0503120.1 GpE family phage tail protein [Morganella morganii subsp. morganii]MDF2405727.1 GpE family phage tail protein [Morganella morganii]PCP71262.1 GpE family phage tail protein [Morganella morganii]
MVADIAAIFHWTPADTAEMSLTELIEWRYHAYKRSGNSE